MNVYPDQLLSEKHMAKSGLKYLRGNILACFRHCAETDIVLYDLTQLPEEFAYMKKYGELLLFTKNQKVRP